MSGSCLKCGALSFKPFDEWFLSCMLCGTLLELYPDKPPVSTYDPQERINRQRYNPLSKVLTFEICTDNKAMLLEERAKGTSWDQVTIKLVGASGAELNSNTVRKYAVMVMEGDPCQINKKKSVLNPSSK